MKDSDIRLKTLAVKLKSQSKLLKPSLDSRLRALEQSVQYARKALAEGKTLDSNLIVNASGLDGMITNWNTILDLMPYTESDSEEAP